MDRGWLKAWIVATLIVATLAIAYESFLRAHRYVPTVQDDADLWSIQYDRVRADPHAVVLLGASRIVFGVDPKLLSQLLGGAHRRDARRQRQLPARGAARAGRGPGLRRPRRRRHRRARPVAPALGDAAVMGRALAGAFRVPAVAVLACGHGAALFRRLHAAIRRLRRAATGSRRVSSITGARTSRRSRRGASPISKRITTTIRRPLRRPGCAISTRSPSGRAESRHEGGRVVFLREPVAGEHLALDEAHYPRERHWDAHARIAPVVMIDFRDEPAFTSFALPDASHIDGAEVPRFTAALAEVLVRRGLVTPGAAPPPPM